MISALLLSVAFATAPPAGFAQPATDRPANSPTLSDGWLAWQGCWRAYGDEDPSSLLCILPEREGARLVTLANGAVRSEMLLVSNGAPRAFEQEGCRGTQKAMWSSDQQRLFVNSTMTCGEAIQRSVSGIMFMQSRTNWTNVESVTTASQTSTRVVRYVAVETGDIPSDIAATLRANKLARETARYTAIAHVDLGDVREAVTHASEGAVTTWLTELNQEFDLSGKKLLALADAGVTPAVLDVLVAVSNPQYFAVATQPEQDDDFGYEGRARRTRAASSCYDPFYDPWLGPMTYNYGYNRCYRYGGHFAPYGNGWDYGYGRPPIIVVRNPSNPKARATREGYTRGTDGVAAPNPEKTTSNPTAGSKESGSGSSTKTTRTAKPRDK